MQFGAIFGLLGLLLAGPALAWSGSAQAGDYRFTANLDSDKLESILLAPRAGIAARPMRLHAWFVDKEGAILAQATLGIANPNGATLIALGKSTPVPTGATALVVMAQPTGVSHTTAASEPALVAQIALH